MLLPTDALMGKIGVAGSPTGPVLSTPVRRKDGTRAVF